MAHLLIVLILALAATVFYVAGLRSEIKRLRAELAKFAPKSGAARDGFTYLALGNSLTRHPECSYWWDDRCGMAASNPEHDYCHLVTAGLARKVGKVNLVAHIFYVWEIQEHDRAETLSTLDTLFTEDVKLITVQLGENVKDVATYESDLVELLNYLKKKAPQAQVIVVGDFWDEAKDAMRKRAAEQTGCDFADLAEIRNQPEYQCPVGSVVHDKDGAPHTVEHPGVARHPGDRGMKFIADAILSQWK